MSTIVHSTVPDTDREGTYLERYEPMLVIELLDLAAAVREDEVREAPRCRRCHGRGCDDCQGTGFDGGREP